MSDADQIDLTTCDQELIHFIGAVQPHGALIAIDAKTHIIDYVSENTEHFVGFTPEMILGKPLSYLIGEENSARAQQMSLEPSTPELLKPWFISFERPNGTTINAECLPHGNDGHVIFEFFEPEPTPAPVWEDELSRQAVISELLKPGDLNDLADASARLIRDVIGFDRVMIYKFAEDKHGEVIAESTSRDDSFLGMHYPASDIPDPARRHFTLNVMRSIPDINSDRVPIVSRSGQIADADSATPLDLTFSKLRAVAPVHVQYLNNMGVSASMSISLVTNNELWGLVACHHYSKRLISSSRLRFAELLGSTTSTLLQNLENTAQLRTGIQAEKTAFYIEQQVRSGRSLRDLIEEQALKIMTLIDVQGMCLVLGGAVLHIGKVPKELLDFTVFRDELNEGIATTEHLPSIIKMNEDQKECAAGAALLDLSDDGEDYLVFLRRSYDQTVNWAGKPEKIETIDENGIKRLSPRGSFALWSEERRGKSKPFDAIIRDALRILRRAFFALNSLERERIALDAQKQAEAEEIRLRHALLDAARANSLGELASAIAHELNQPLSAIANYVSACRQELRNANVTIPERAGVLIEDAVIETERAGDLVRRVRDFITRGDLNTEYIDLNKVIQQGVDLALVTCQLPDLKVNVRQDLTIPKVLADPVQIGQVMLNLARNSIAAMKHSDNQVLTIGVTQQTGFVQVTVSDSGSGIPADVAKYIFEPFHTSTTKGMGIGLSLCRSIIEAHSGKIWFEPSQSGAILSFKLPISENENG